jgi:excisionase family DNA binding protein
MLAQEIADELLRRGVGAPQVQPRAQRRVLDIKGAAEYLGCGLTKIRELESRGELKRVEFDASLRFDIRDLDRFIEEHKL